MNIPGGTACPTSLIAAANMLYLRKRRGWSQPDLARASGLSGPMISFLEGGKRDFRLPTMEKIAAALDVSVPELLLTPAQQAAFKALTIITDGSREAVS